MMYNIPDDFRRDARRMANFYQGLSLILDGDDDQDDGFKYLAEIFGIALSGGRLGIAELDFIAVGCAAGLFDKYEDINDVWPRTLALRDLLERIGKSGITREEIDLIAAESEKPQAA